MLYILVWILPPKQETEVMMGLLNVQKLSPFQDKGHNFERCLTLCRDVSSGIPPFKQLSQNVGEMLAWRKDLSVKGMV